MARWDAKLSSNINKTEVIARRRFTHPELRGGAGRKPSGGLDYRDFLETRDRQVSVDRLGRTGIENSVLAYLRPRAEEHGKSFSPKMDFLGWASITAGKFLEVAGKVGYTVAPSPISGGFPQDNDYHAHIEMPSGEEATHVALYLSHVFYLYGSSRDVDQRISAGSNGKKIASPNFSWAAVVNLLSLVWGKVRD